MEKISISKLIYQTYSFIFFWKKLSLRKRFFIFSASLLIFMTGLIAILHSFIEPLKAEAAWFDDTWAFRKAIEISAHTSAETNIYLNLTGSNDIDTAALISAGKMQSDCGDLRFTDKNGNLLSYYIVSGCNSTDTIVHVFLANFPAGAQTFYYYYGNPGASNGTVASDFATPASGVTFGTVGSEENSTGPILYYRLDEGTGSTAKDSSQNNFDGTLNNTPTYQSEDMCVAGKCLWFDGTNNENISKSDESLLDFAASDNFTISAWVRRNGPSSANNFIITKAQAGYTGYKLYQDASGDYCFDISDGTNTDSACTVSVDFDDDKWHHVAGVKNGTTSITLYVDGKQRAQDSSIAATGTLANTGTFYVGVDLNGTSNEWLGFIDEVKVYRYAKSASQIHAEYTVRGGRNGSNILGARTDSNLADGLIAYWKMDETSWNGTSGEVIDSSGNNYHGTAYCTGSGCSLPNTENAKYGKGGKYINSILPSRKQFVYVGDVDALDVNENDSITIAVWIRHDDLVDNVNTIVGKYNCCGEAGYNFYVNNEPFNRTLGFDISDGTDMLETSGSTTLPLNTWVHAVAVFDRTNKANTKIYLNGVAENITTNGIAQENIGNPSNSAFLKLGAYGNDLTTTYGDIENGFLDEVRIYKRALTESEVKKLYEWSPKPVGYWDFEEKQGTITKDKSGNENSGTLTGSPVWTNGKFGSGLDFSTSSNTYVNIGSPTMLDNLPAKGGITIGAWIYPKNLTQIADIINKYDSSGWEFAQSQDRIQFFASFNNDGALNDLDVLSAPGTLPTANQWYYVAVTWDGTSEADNVHLYVNGIETNYITRDDGLNNRDSDASEELRIGADGANLNLIIDEVKIYNYIRTRQQIIEDMNAGHPPGGSPIGSQVAYWKMNEGYGSVINSSVNNFNITGSINGAAWTNGGKFAKALHFDGTDDVVTVSNTSAIDFDLNLASGSAFSVWVRPTNAGESNAGQIWNKGANRYLGVAPGSNSSVLDLTASLDLETSDATITIDDALPVGAWSHIVMQHADDSDDEIEIYVNSKLAGVSSNGVGRPTSGSLSDTSNLLIGGPTSNNFAGDIDEFKIYSYALTPSQIKIDYNNNSGMSFGSISTDISSVATNSAERSYCPPGDTTVFCSPLHEYNFEEASGTIAYDTGVASTSYNGTLTGGSTFQSGKIGKSVDFDGNNSYINFGSNELYQETAAFTITAWIYPRSLTNDILIACDQNRSGTCFFATASYSVTNGLAYCGSSGCNTEANDGNSNNNVITINAWNHVALSYDGSPGPTSCTFYVNGRDVTSDSDCGETAGSYSTQIGGASSSGIYSNAKMDQIRFYNYVLTPNQIAWEYNKGKPIAHWKMDECQGTTIHDSSGNGNSATWNGASSGTQTSVGTCTTNATTAWYQGRNGKFNASLNFDGTDDYLEIPDSELLRPGNGSFTISVWANPPNSPQISALIAKRQNSSPYEQYGMYIMNDHTGNVAGKRLSAQVQESYITISRRTITTDAVVDGNWHNYVMVADRAADAVLIYIDGKQVPTTIDNIGASWPTVDNTDPLRIGEANGLAAYSGQIDEVQIFNYALSPKQIKNLYNLGAIRFAPLTGAP